MHTLIFTICGNQEDPNGNAIPKLKLTAGQKWGKVGEKMRRYVAWKEYVQQALQPHLVALAIDMPVVPAAKVVKGGSRYLKPITIVENIRMAIKIFWADETHADPESIYGSIADAIFVDDKHLYCDGIDFEHSPEKKGRVEVKITL